MFAQGAGTINGSVGFGPEARVPIQDVRGKHDTENQGEIVSILRQFLRLTDDLETR